MSARLALVIAFFRRIDAAVATTMAPGSAGDRGVAFIARSRWRAVAALKARIPEPARQPLARARTILDRGLQAATADPSGVAGAVLAVILAWVLTRILWTPLSWPASIVNSAIVTVTPASCAMFGPRNLISDNVCGTVLALLTVAGALIATLALALIRTPLRRAFTAIVGAGAGPAHFLVTPLTAALLFTVGWAGVQFHFPDRAGIVRDGDFPALVGLTTYALQRYGPLLHRHASLVFAWRESIALPARVGMLIAIPLVLSLATIPIWHPPVRDQAGVLAGMLAAYLLFAQRPAEPAGRP